MSDRDGTDTLPIGVFHEVSISVEDLARSVAFYRSLGWHDVPARAAWPHPYAALTDGTVTLGLHRRRFPSPSLTFLHPEVGTALEEHRDAGMVVDFSRIGTGCLDAFGFRDPHDHRVTLIGSPIHDGPDPTRHAGMTGGSFVSLPASDPDLALRFWTLLGARRWAGAARRRFETAGLPMAVHVPKAPAAQRCPLIVTARVDRRLEAPEGTLLAPDGD